MQMHNENGSVITTNIYERTTRIYPHAPMPSFADCRASLTKKQNNRSMNPQSFTYILHLSSK